MKSIFDEAAYLEIKDRLSALSPDSPRKWGKMTAAQMVWHCQVPVKLAVDNKKYRVRGNPLVRWLFKSALYNDRPWRKSLPTAKIAKATEDKDFLTEHAKLLHLLEELYKVRTREVWNPHPLFGTFSRQQWGQMQYKHLDHHLRQFGH